MDQRTTPRSTARSSAQRVVRSLVVGQVLGGAVLATVVAGGVGPFDTLASAAGDVEVLAAGTGGASASAAGPARWGACRPVELFVDTDGAPAGWDAVVEAATERVAAESGLQLRFAGAVDVEAVTTPAEDEPAAAVLAWAGADEQPQLTTETALTTHVAHGPAGGPRHVVLAWSVVRTGASTPVDHALAELFSERHVPSPGAVAGC